MEIKIPVGIKHRKEITVADNHSAKAYGSGLVDVLATPALIALMENTSLESIESFLPEGYTTVGAEVSIKHLKATPLGVTISCDSRLSEVNGRKLVFEMHAWDPKGMIGIGTHIRYIVETKLFMEKLK